MRSAWETVKVWLKHQRSVPAEKIVEAAGAMPLGSQPRKPSHEDRSLMKIIVQRSGGRRNTKDMDRPASRREPTGGSPIEACPREWCRTRLRPPASRTGPPTPSGPISTGRRCRSVNWRGPGGNPAKDGPGPGRDCVERPGPIDGLPRSRSHPAVRPKHVPQAVPLIPCQVPPERPPV